MISAQQAASARTFPRCPRPGSRKLSHPLLSRPMRLTFLLPPPSQLAGLGQQRILAGSGGMGRESKPGVLGGKRGRKLWLCRTQSSLGSILHKTEPNAKVLSSTGPAGTGDKAKKTALLLHLRGSWNRGKANGPQTKQSQCRKMGKVQREQGGGGQGEWGVHLTSPWRRDCGSLTHCWLQCPAHAGVTKCVD